MNVENQRTTRPPPPPPIWRAHLVLPYPLSLNRLYRSVVVKGHARVLLSAEGREYKRDVGWLAREAGFRKPLVGRLSLRYLIYPHRPKDWEKRMRKLGPAWADTVQCIDTGNAEKALCDALQGVVYENDAQLWEVWGRKAEPDARGARLEVEITRMPYSTNQPGEVLL